MTNRTFKRKAQEVRAAAERLTEGLSGRRDLVKLSPWLAEFPPASGKPPDLAAYNSCTALMICPPEYLMLSEICFKTLSSTEVAWAWHDWCWPRMLSSALAETRLLRLAALCPVLSASYFKTGAGEELGEPLLLPWMPSMGTLAGSLPPDVHVVGFAKTVSVFSSKQKPKELTVYGSDFRY